MDSSIRLRSAELSDLQVIADLAVSSGLFDAEGWAETAGIVRSCVAGESPGQVWIATRDRVALGAAYAAPEPFAHSMWNLYFLAVTSSAQGTGCGSALVDHVESTARRSGVSRLIIETSSQSSFAPTRRFYERLNYVREAQVRDFYGPGDAKVVYWKALDAHAGSVGGESAPAALIGADRDGRIAIWNTEAEKLIGFPQAEVFGREITMIVPDEYLDGHRSGFQRVMAGGPRSIDAPFHLPVRCASGEVNTFAARFVYLDDAAGHPAGAVVVLRSADSGAEPWTVAP